MSKEKLSQLGYYILMGVMFGAVAAEAAPTLIGLAVPVWLGAFIGMAVGAVYTFARD